VLLILSILSIGESVSLEGSDFVQSRIPKVCAVNFINILIFFSFWTYISQVTPQQLVFSSLPRIYNIKRAKRSHVTRDPEQTKTISVRNEKELSDLILTFQEDRRYSSPPPSLQKSQATKSEAVRTLFLGNTRTHEI
jgi:hypothetical protein